MFPHHQPIGDPPLPLDPLPGSLLMRAHELAAFTETTLNSNENRDRLTVRGIAVDDLKVCIDLLPAAAGVGTRLWVDLRGVAAPRLTADRKTALAKEDVDDWPSVFEGVFQRWCGWLQELLNRHQLQLVSGLLSAFAVKSKLRPRMPATSQLPRWQLKVAGRPAEWVGRWLIGLLSQEVILARTPDFALARDRALARDFALDLVPDLVPDPDLDPALARDFTRALALALTLALARDLALTRDLARIHARTKNHTHARTNNITWKVSVILHLLSEAFADDLSRSLPALGVCGLKGRAGDGWLTAPCWIEWDVNSKTAKVRRDSPKQQWSQPLIDKDYDLVFPLTNVPLGQLRRDCPEWRTDRRFRALGVLAYFFLGSEKWLKENSQKFLDLFKVTHIHALMPKPELWLKRFDDWTETDWSTCGLSVLWNIESGVVYWAEGAHKADDMKRVGKPIEQFIGSKKKRR